MPPICKVGLGEICLVACNLQPQQIISKEHFPAPAAFLIIIILNKNNLFEFKHVDGSDESSMPNSIRMLSSEDSSIEQYQINMNEVLNELSNVTKATLQRA